MLTLFLLSLFCFITAITLTIKLKRDVRTNDRQRHDNNRTVDSWPIRDYRHGYCLYTLEKK